MIITCPHCGFSKNSDPIRIPDTAKKVGCPLCKKNFFLSDGIFPAAVADDARPDPEEESTAVPPEPGDTAPLPPPDAPTLANAAGMPKAGFWIRTVAALLDSLLTGLIQSVVSFILMMTARHLLGEMDLSSDVAVSFLVTLAGFIIVVTYSVFFTGYCGQTPGKMALGIKVIRTSGDGIGYGRAFLREVPGKFLSGILLGIGYLMVAFDENKQGLHDRIADTYVIKL